MELLQFFNTLTFFNFSIIIFALYILFSTFYNVSLGYSETYAFPVLLNASLMFSIFILTTTLVFFGMDLEIFSFDSNFLTFNLLFQSVFFFASIFVLLITRDFVGARSINKFEYDLLFSFLILSAVCLCFSDDFLQIYIAIELQSLCLYVFASFNRHSEFSTESGLKYFIFGAIISCFLLLGFSFVYLTFGSTSFEILMNLMIDSHNNFLFFGIVFVLVALLFKIGAAPFHVWLCDVYDGSVISVTFLFAALPKIIIFGVFIKIFLIVFSTFDTQLMPFLLFASLTSICVGSLSALYQKRLKRLFAYSTIAHTGFILLGFVASYSESIETIFFYVIAYTCLTILLFSIIIFASVSTTRFPVYIVSWTASSGKNQVFILSFTLALFSIAGIPPLIGFFSKFFILTAFITQEFYFSGLFLVIVSSIGCFYYIRLIKTFFFVKSSKNTFWISSTKRQYSEYIISCFLFINLFFIIKPTLLTNITHVISVCV